MRQTTPNQEALVLALLKWYFQRGASESPDGLPWDEWVGAEARRLQPWVEVDRAALAKNKELLSFLSQCRKKFFDLNTKLANNEYMNA